MKQKTRKKKKKERRESKWSDQCDWLILLSYFASILILSISINACQLIELEAKLEPILSHCTAHIHVSFIIAIAAFHSPLTPINPISSWKDHCKPPLSKIAHHGDVLQVEYPWIEWWLAWREWHTSWCLRRVRQGMLQLTLEEHQWLKIGIEGPTWSLVRFLWPIFGKEVFWSRVRSTFGIVWFLEERRYLAYICVASWHLQLMVRISEDLLALFGMKVIDKLTLAAFEASCFLGALPPVDSVVLLDSVEDCWRVGLTSCGLLGSGHCEWAQWMLLYWLVCMRWVDDCLKAGRWEQKIK